MVVQLLVNHQVFKANREGQNLIWVDGTEGRDEEAAHIETAV